MELTNNDTWVVLSPMRTGSKAISFCIQQSYAHKNIQLNFFTPGDKLTNQIPYRSIWQYHNHEILDHLNDNTRVVISVRDPREIALSLCIAEHFKHWHVWHSDPKLVLQTRKQTPKYKIKPERFIENFSETVIRYNNILENNNYTRINYEDWKDDLSVVFKTLGIPTPANIFLPIVKNPAPLKEWVKNWDEISEIFNNLPHFSH